MYVQHVQTRIYTAPVKLNDSNTYRHLITDIFTENCLPRTGVFPFNLA